jgi:type I restriction enzyme S subunit
MFLNSSVGKEMVASKAVGAAQKHFNVGAAKEVEFAYPKLEEQTAFVDKAVLVRSRSEKLKAAYMEKIAHIAMLRQSLLQKAFSGQLT